ncbi:MAG: hypothetical protein WC684_06860 [Hyphomicrobium sp.]|jgi:hypothetical protein
MSQLLFDESREEVLRAALHHISCLRVRLIELRDLIDEDDECGIDGYDLAAFERMALELHLTLSSLNPDL